MVGLHHAHPEHFVAELGEEDQADDAELAGVREDDVGSVRHLRRIVQSIKNKEEFDES